MQAGSGGGVLGGLTGLDESSKMMLLLLLGTSAVVALLYARPYRPLIAQWGGSNDGVCSRSGTA